MPLRGKSDPAARGDTAQMPALGRELRETEFGHLDPDVVRLNHGERCFLCNSPH